MALELLDALVKAGDDVLQLLELILNETHLGGFFFGWRREGGKEDGALEGDDGRIEGRVVNWGGEGERGDREVGSEEWNGEKKQGKKRTA
jgi:hypothetical protein